MLDAGAAIPGTRPKVRDDASLVSVPRIIVEWPPCSQSTAVRAYIKCLPIYECLVSSRPMNLSQLFHPAVAKWFIGHFVQPTPAQAQAWPAIKAGRHTLIAAPTGSGKTLAAVLAAIDAHRCDPGGLRLAAQGAFQ